MAATLSAELFVSADGWARGERSPGYFGYFGPDLERWLEEGSARPRRVLMGRRTYEALDALPPEHRDEGYERMARTPTTVFSTTLAAVDWPGASLESGDLIESVRALKERSDVPLCTVGSLSVVRQLLDAGLVDRLRLMVFPLLVGPGGREAMLEGVGEADLELVGHRVLDGRLLLVEYAPTGRPVPH
ncbi:dihydrofolate reductase family protein [Glycomyces sp. A-F 0318]|uniref:dihydrofolate reductase family protein n=1 Tax=Glycomyces amatae TaxID=2881355 RepID=UPI001E459709|nr:dihydrofolate reductase family protein [Glycomyces amatae]MCD0445060.1 dihydrofolate reductase family protein [Glycomyces amatae]